MGESTRRCRKGLRCGGSPSGYQSNTRAVDVSVTLRGYDLLYVPKLARRSFLDLSY